MEITQDQFQAYEDLRGEGSINMVMINSVADLTDLTPEQVMYIQKNYSELKKKYV